MSVPMIDRMFESDAPPVTQGEVRIAIAAAVDTFTQWWGDVDLESDDKALAVLLDLVMFDVHERPPVDRLAALLVDRHRDWLASEALYHAPPRALITAQHRRVHRLADRDGWCCYLCHEPLADTCAHGPVMPRELHRWLAVVEHVVPRALGGANTPDNVRLACWPCNARKGSQ